MNYILKLQQEVAARDRALISTRQGLRDLRQHLELPKFNGTDQDGERLDWIATADVSRWLDNIETNLHVDPVIEDDPAVEAALAASPAW